MLGCVSCIAFSHSFEFKRSSIYYSKCVVTNCHTGAPLIHPPSCLVLCKRGPATQNTDIVINCANHIPQLSSPLRQRSTTVGGSGGITINSLMLDKSYSPRTASERPPVDRSTGSRRGNTRRCLELRETPCRSLQA